MLGVFSEYFVIATSFPGVARLLPIMASSWDLEGGPDYG